MALYNLDQAGVMYHFTKMPSLYIKAKYNWTIKEIRKLNQNAFTSGK